MIRQGLNCIWAFVTVVFAVLVLGTSGVSYGGDLQPTSSPATTSSYGLEDIYNRLDTGAAGTRNTFTGPTTEPGSTGHTLDDVMGLAPEVDGTNGATATDVLSGKTFWGLTSGEWGVNTGTAPPAEVPKTGQTSSGGTGDDGELQKGVTWPNSRFTADNGTVTDNLTGLVWLRNANCASATRNWTAALTEVANLNSGGTMNMHDCGDTSNSGSHQTDWRLPNVRELQSLIHYGKSDPALSDNHPFTGIESSNYWSSTTYVDSTSFAWSVNLLDGPVSYTNASNSYYVWPVRGGR